MADSSLRVAGDHESRDQAEYLIVLAFVLTRVTVLAALLSGVETGFQVARHPLAYLLGFVVVCVWSAVLIGKALRGRRMPSPAWGYVDVVLCALSCLLCAVTLPPNPIGYWAGGFGGNVTSTVGTWARDRRHVPAIPALVLVHLVAAIVVNGTWWVSLVADVCIWVGFGFAAWLVCTTWRALGDAADYHRLQAATMAEERARDQARLVMHDPAAILRMLADPALPEASLAALREQAGLESRRMRTYMSDEPIWTPVEVPGATVAAAVRDGLRGFEDLPTEVAVDLALGAAIEGPVYAALAGAVSTCLHNVREHAGASQVFVHADADGDSWEVVIRDDGRGFDPDSVRYGNGLRVLVVGNLIAHGVTPRIESAPGRGATVTMVGPTAAAPPGR